MEVAHSPGHKAHKRFAIRELVFSPLGVFFLLGAAIFAVYFNALDNQFVFDDYFVVLDNGAIRRAPREWSTFFSLGDEGQIRPLRALSYAIAYRLGGFRPFVYHLFNVIYHWLAAYLAFLVFLQVARDDIQDTQSVGNSICYSPFGVAFLAALLWALHPIQTESVAYIAGQQNILVGIFFFLSFYAFLRFRTLSHKPQIMRRRLWLGVTFLAFGLGLLSKEIAVTLPFIFFAYEFCSHYSHQSGLWRRIGQCLWQNKFLYLFILGVALFTLPYYLSRYYLNYLTPLLKRRGESPIVTFATVPRIWLHYLELLVFPLPLNADYAGAFPLSSSFLEGRVLLAIAILSILVAAMWYGLKWGYRLSVFCGLWFMITLLPVSQIFPHPQIIAEHYLYLPSFGFCSLLALMLVRLLKRSRKIGYGLLATLLAFYCTRTVVRNQDWQDEETFWRKTVETASTSPRAHHNLGAVLKKKGDLTGALAQLQAAVVLDPHYGYSYTIMAEISLREQRFSDALPLAQKGVKLRPEWPWSHFILGLVYRRLGEPQKAASSFEKTLALRPGFSPASRLLAELRREMEDQEKIGQ